MRLEDLAIDHPYYCSDNNYFSRDAEGNWNTMAEFLDEYEDADIDMNLIFRWDVFSPEEFGDNYRANIFIMHQRHGIFAPQIIMSVEESDVERFVAILRKHQDYLKELWLPL